MRAEENIKKSFIISLEGSPRRKKLKQMKTACFFRAVDSRNNYNIVLKKYGFSEKIKIFKNHFNTYKGAYGCFISHHLCWELISKSSSNKWFLILEDDIDTASLQSFLDSDFTFPDYDIIDLGVKGIQGSEAYLIKANACEKLLEQSNKTIQAPVDRFLFQSQDWKRWAKSKGVKTAQSFHTLKVSKPLKLIKSSEEALNRELFAKKDNRQTAKFI